MWQEEQQQTVIHIPLRQLKAFPNHPFQVREDGEFEELVKSIATHGVIHPAVARPVGEGCYELISGHRRKAACEALGYAEMPVLVRAMTDDEAVVSMVDANLQRETILPSERAYAYKMKMAAIPWPTTARRTPTRSISLWTVNPSPKLQRWHPALPCPVSDF